MTDQQAAPVRDETEAPEAAASPEKKGGSKAIVAVVGVLAVLLLAVAAVFVVRNVLPADDPTGDAKAGDCLANLPQAVEGKETGVKDAKVVACDAPEARFAVVGRVDDVTAEQASASEVCAPYAETTMRYYAIPSGGKGYVLCLKPA